MLRLGRKGTLLLLALSGVFIIVLLTNDTTRNTPSSIFASFREPVLHLGTTSNTHGLYVIPRSTISDLDEHPISTLLRRARFQAAALEKQIQSVRSLGDAVKDYRETFGMDPPLGFDRWYEFCVRTHSVPVPSLLPPAHGSILPYLAYPGELLRTRIKALEEKQATWWFEIVYDEEAEALGEDANRVRGEDGVWRGVKRGGDANEKGPRARDMAKLYQGILPYIPRPPHTTPSIPAPPPLRLAFGMHDGPSFLTTSTIYQACLSLARHNRTWDPLELEDAEKEAMTREVDRKGWKWACAGESPMWRENGGMGIGGGGKVVVEPERAEQLEKNKTKEIVESGTRTFIGDMALSIDFCHNPALMELHGTLLNDISRKPAPMVPLISTSKTLYNADVLSTPLEATNQTQELMKWSSKTENRLFWRGKLTGAFHNSWTSWRQSQRERASFLVNRVEGEIEVLVESDDQVGGRPELRTFSARELNEWYMDIAPVDGPVQCDPGECEKVAEAMTFGLRVPMKDQVKYKYILDVDGNAWSSRFRRLLTGMSVTLKSTIFPEWNSAMLIPWYHYIPVQVDYSDIYDIMLYFVGQPDRPGSGHDSEAERIATNAREFATERWRYEDMQSYMLLVTLEYQRAVSDDRAAASFRM